LIDKKFGIIDGKQVSRKFVEKCPKCSIYTINDLFIKLLLAPDVLMVDIEQVKQKKVAKMLKLVSKFNKTYFDMEKNSIEGDEDKGLPVKIFPEAGEKVKALQPLGMNHD